MITPYLCDIINDHKTFKKIKVHLGNKIIDHETQFAEWKIQLTALINFISTKYFKETHIMYTRIHNIEIMIGNKTEDITDELFKSLLQNYQDNLEESMRGSEFIPDSVNLLYYHLHKISLKRGGSYIDSTKWLKNNKVKINPQYDDDDDDDDDDDRCLEYAIIAARHWKEIDNHPERI